jgi:hypothetical protein
MNLSYRPLVAAVCSLLMLLAAVPAFGQKFLPQDIVEADPITEEMNDRILAIVDPAMFDLSRDADDDGQVRAKSVAEARQQLLQLFRVSQPSVAYLEALSKAISGGRMKDAVEHESPLVRINAMIVLKEMVDDNSKVFIDQGLTDESDAVKRWAMEALGTRMRWWKARAANPANARNVQSKIDAAIKQIETLLTQESPPHPIVVSSGLEALFAVDTALSRETLIRILNARVPLHADNPDLSYSAERAVVDALWNRLATEVRQDRASIKELTRAMHRFSAVIVGQSQADLISEDMQRGAKEMLFQSLQGMANLSVTMQAPNAPPADSGQARNWIINDRWDELNKLVKEDWTPILAAEPFGLRPAALAISP